MKRLFVYTACIAVLLSSCANSGKQKQIVSDVDMKAVDKMAVQPGMAADTAATSSTVQNAPPVPQSGTPINPDWDKKIIKTAHVTLELKDYNAYNSNIHAKVKNYGLILHRNNRTKPANR